MQKPRQSILQLFDPLMAGSPHTPGREVASASPDNSDKENDLPISSTDTLSLTQFFSRIHKVERQQKAATPRTPDGKLIDFGDLTIDDDDQLVSISLDERDLSECDASFLSEGEDSENAASFIRRDIQEADSRVGDYPQVFMTPQNRKILADIDIDTSHPPKPPVKQGTLKISFLRHVMNPKHEPIPSSSGTSQSVAVSGPGESAPHAVVCDTSPSIPAIALHPPTSEPQSSPEIQTSVNRSGNQLSPEASSYFGDSPSAPIPRRTLPSVAFDNHRISIDLQSSFQLQLQSSDFSFDLVNDRVSFFGGQGSFIDGIEDYLGLNSDEEQRNADELAKNGCSEEADSAAVTIFGKSPSASVPPSPASVADAECIATPEIATPPHQVANDITKPVDGEPESAKTIPALRIVKTTHKHQDSTSSGSSRASCRLSSTTSSDSGVSPGMLVPNSKATVGMKLPMRLPLVKSNTENSLPVRNAVTSSTRLAAPSANGITGFRHGAAMKASATKSQPDLTEGPKRVLVQPRSIAEQCSGKDGKLSNVFTGGHGSKGTGPQRVLVRPSAPSIISKPSKKVALDSTSTSSSVSAPRLSASSTTTSRIASFARRPVTKIGHVSKLSGAGKKM